MDEEQAPNEEAKPNGEIPASEITGALTVPDRLSEEHMELFSPAFSLFQAAQEQLNKATQALQAAQERLGQAQLGREAAAGAVRYVAEYLRPKYGMKPTDDIDSEGKILRTGA